MESNPTSPVPLQNDDLEKSFIIRDLEDLKTRMTRNYSWAYKILSRPRMTRVLHIMPGRGDETIVCNVRTINLDENPTYEALSYCWGDPKPSSQIILEGRSAYISLNLYKALQELRSRTEMRVLWADALSIDQSNSSEKSQQILLMRQIYRQARKVLIYLGEFGDMETTSNVVQLVRELAKCYVHSDQNWRFSLEENIQYLGLPGVDSEIWTKLTDFLDLPWFGRVWVIQEVSLSRHAHVAISGLILDWEDLAEACYVLDDSGLSSLVLGAKHRNVNCMDFCRWSLARGNELDPLKLAEQARTFATTDSRDRIYGLLGLFETVQSKFDIVDYNLSISEVYSSFTFYCIRRYENLDVFGSLHSSPAASNSCNRTEGIPSWATDWGKARKGRQLTTDPSYNASIGRAPGVTRLSSCILKLRGLCVDIVKDTGAPLLSDARYSRQFPGLQDQVDSIECSSTIKTWFQAVSQLPPKYPTGQWKGHAFAKTLAAGCGDKPWESVKIPFQQKFEMRYTGDRIAFYEYLWWWLEEILGHKVDIDRSAIFPDGRTDMELLGGWGIYPRWANSSSDPEYDAPRLGKEISLIVAGASGYTTFFVSTHGWMGTGPINTQVGDMICILYGARTPTILRKNKDDHTYQLIGETYVHGLMFGAALNLGLEEEDFMIC
jgi:hypothetical protein